MDRKQYEKRTRAMKRRKTIARKCSLKYGSYDRRTVLAVLMLDVAKERLKLSLEET